MMSVFSGTVGKNVRRGLVIFGLMAMMNLLVIAATWAEEATTAQPAPKVMLKTKFGEMEIVVFPDLAPKHVESFLKLTESGFYNGTLFHRIIPKFMIQGGDPLTKDPANRSRYGTGDPGYMLPAEFNKIKFERGILGAARSTNPNSAGSQFFIMVDKFPDLDGKYTVFGEVVKGIEVADTIVSQPRYKPGEKPSEIPDNLPKERIEMTIEVMK